MENDPVRSAAVHAFRIAYRHHRYGRLDHAIHHYRRSLELLPSAEAHAFLGWALSFRGDLNGAIRQCMRAITLDPEFSNPYNDIGAYLIELGRPDEAFPWLRSALQAPRAHSYCYPHYNMGRAHEALGEMDGAISAYDRALTEDPSFIPALLSVRKLRSL